MTESEIVEAVRHVKTIGGGWFTAYPMIQGQVKIEYRFRMPDASESDKSTLVVIREMTPEKLLEECRKLHLVGIGVQFDMRNRRFMGETRFSRPIVEKATVPESSILDAR